MGSSRIYVGYDPGGKGANAVALLWVDGGPRRFALNRDVGSVDGAIDWIMRMAGGGMEPAAAGIDALLCWETGVAGRRGQDEWISRQMSAVKREVAEPHGRAFQERQCRAPSVQSANSLRGSMLFQGMAAAIRLRERWPAIPITETHPKALHFALRKATYPEAGTWEPEQDICRWLLDALGHPEGDPINSSDQWDALASAWAAYMGHSGAWSVDLMRAARCPILPAGPVHYWWPVDLTRRLREAALAVPA
ncbi:hypothetical protein [Azospirillum sp. ST 5-10]|uniref:hypothetical protein n=1 Tax=unclassified Azospirillum TaxID=2630922 RepID=UPI003F4A4B17